MYIKINNNHIELIKSANPYLIFATIFVFIIGLYYSLFQSPPDYIQGDSMRIMYIHVPSAWFALMTYSILAGSCVLWFITRNPLFNVVARSIAQVGMVFTLMSLITGSIWGKPTWGVWWVWDTLRGFSSGNDPYLWWNTPARQVTDTDYVDPLSNGFQLTNTAPGSGMKLNVSGEKVLYLAFA